MIKCIARAGRGLVIVAVGMSVAFSGRVQSQDKGFADMSLEEFMDVPVTSVSKKTTKLGESPAAITIITQDDLRRLGITNLPDALRLVHQTN